MPNFFQKTAFKIKTLFTNPKLFWAIVAGLWDHYIRRRGHFNENIPNRLSTDAESETLQKYAANARLGIVEIGVFDGGNTKVMSKNAHVPIYGIDPIIPDSMVPHTGHEEFIRENMQGYKDFHFIKDYSYNAVKGWNKPFDFIFIDGDHHYEPVKQDFEDWYPVLAPGGFVAFHDSGTVTSIPVVYDGCEGPTRLVKELKKHPGLQFIEQVDSLGVFKKI